MRFRQWCHEMWLEHCDEVRDWTGNAPPYTGEDYFRTYKWWLRTMFRSRG